MGDSLLLLQSRPINEVYAWGLLVGYDLDLNKDTIPWILAHTDAFVSESQGNESVQYVCLYPHSFNCNGHEDEVWDKIGQAIGNLQALKAIGISTSDRGSYGDIDSEVLPVSNLKWERLARILSHVRQKFQLQLNDGVEDSFSLAGEEVKALARVIRGHPTITYFGSDYRLPYEASLYSALATLPALELVSLNYTGLEAGYTGLEDDISLARSESLTELLRVTSLRSVAFDNFSFAPTLCQATANALMEGTAVTNIEFGECNFWTEESLAILARGLEINTSVISIRVGSSNDRSPLVALAAALPLNSTLRTLYLECDSISDVFLLPLILALGKNTGVEKFSIQSDSRSYSRLRPMEVEKYLELVTALQHNTTLKILHFGTRSTFLRTAPDLDKQMASLLKKNFALESVSQIGSSGDAGAMLRLNAAGRRYLIEDGSSISKGVDVLSRVNNDVNCVFLHLLENPNLCDRSAVEKVSADESNGSLTSPTATGDGGKRKQASLHGTEKSRRKLA